MVRDKATEVIRRGLRSDLACSKMVSDLLEGMSGGELTPGDRLPPEVRLRDQYGISVTSVRRGMDMLVREGLLSRQRGSGTYIRHLVEPEIPAKVDTIMVCRYIHHPPSHPYFGYVPKGLRERMTELGWTMRNAVTAGVPADTQRGTDYGSVNINDLREELTSQNNIAGVVLKGRSDEARRCVMETGIPCVEEDPNDICPFVGYDWDEELTRAVRLGLRTGAKHIWLVAAGNDNKMTQIIASARAAERVDSSVTVSYKIVECTKIYSQSTHSAYVTTKELLRKEKNIDAIVIGDDFEAQGVLDALSELDNGRARNIHVISLANKESKIHTLLPYTALVSDGYAHGRAVADLLNRIITEPATAPDHVYLSTTIEACPGFPRHATT